MRSPWRRLAQWRFTAVLVMLACDEDSSLEGLDAAMQAPDAARETPDAAREAPDAATREPVDYVPAPADGGTCPLEDVLSFAVRIGVDGFLDVALELRPPSTIWQQDADGSILVTGGCTYPAPACEDPTLPDFAEVRALLADPEIVALRQRPYVPFGNSATERMVSRWLAFGPISGDANAIVIYDDPPLCSSADDDAGVDDCVPDVVDRLFDLVQSFQAIHACNSRMSDSGR